jgi:hypothetical protein
MRLTVSSLLAVLFLSCPFACADNQSTDQQIARLEQKYFGRTYSGESDEARTARIEKLVFGEASEGDAAGRIKKIVEATGIDLAPPVAPTPATSEAVQEEAPKPVAPALAPSRVESDTETAVEGEDAYPHVVELENAILGRNYAGQQLSGRISRMEVKAFGKASNNPDLSARTDALDQYADQKLHKRSGSTSDSDGPADSQGSSPTDYPRVDALEKAILGQMYAGQPLADRLNRMEVQAFGAASKNDDMSQRTDALERYAEKTLHKKPLDPEGNNSGGDNQTASGKSPFLSKIGRAIVGMAGSTVSNFGTGGFGPGFGSGYGPGGFGGMGMSPRTQQRSNDDMGEEAEAKNEDPYVTDPNPPGANAKLISKVGWCEMQVFGHTSPELHLEKRLDQLNERLNFAPGKTEAQLMDHIPEMMKMVIAQKQPSKPLASSAKSPTR